MAMPEGIDPATRYNATARLLHGVIAVLVIGNVIGGLLHDALEDTFNVMPLHKSIGLTVLFLSIVRIGWRFTWKTPEYRPPLKPFDRMVAMAVHWTFYALIVILPVTGWIMASGGSRPLAWFGIPFPKLDVQKDTPLYEVGHEGHEILGFVMLGLVVLHVTAALRHHYMLKGGVLRRMW
jgi:cytochrome b561